MRVASKVGNLPSKFWHDRPLGCRIIRYVGYPTDGRRTDVRTDTSNAYCPFRTGGGIIVSTGLHFLSSRGGDCEFVTDGKARCVIVDIVTSVIGLILGDMTLVQMPSRCQVDGSKLKKIVPTIVRGRSSRDIITSAAARSPVHTPLPLFSVCILFIFASAVL